MEIEKGIREAIEANQLVIFVGSGLSMRFGLPNWNTLVKEVISKIGDAKYIPFVQLMNDGMMSPLDILEKLKPNHNEIHSYIKQKFKISSDHNDLNFHKKLFQLTGKIITTNFDNAFELATENKLTPTIYNSEFNVSELNKKSEGYIYKLHGCYSTPDQCVLFKDKYEELYSNETAAIDKLKSIFIDKTILFIGFGFNDPDLNYIFNKLDKVFANNNKHYILTPESERFEKFHFLKCINIENHSKIDEYIDLCLEIKNERPIQKDEIVNVRKEKKLPKIAFLTPKAIDQQFDGEFDEILECFESIECNIFIGVLNLRTLTKLEDFDLVVIASKVFKSNIYIEEDNLLSNLISPSEIYSNIPNDEMPVLFITDGKIDTINSTKIAYISSFKGALIKKFIIKTLREGRFDFNEHEITFSNSQWICFKFIKGNANKFSLYDNNRDLAIGKKCLTSVVGRVEEQSLIASRLLNVIKTGKLLNIKASGGTGKTTLIKKVGYELYNRGYFREGVNFKSCENVKSYNDFEEILLSGFSLTNIIDFKDYLITNYSNSKLDLLVILDNFETVVNLLSTDELNKAIDLLKFATDYSNIVVTSREKISSSDDFEEVYSLTPLVTDDAVILFQKNYGMITDESELKILRQDILEDLLNNNPLAIKLVTKSRTRFKYVSELREQLKEHFFECINEDYSSVFHNNADLNIERTKSIFQSINYSYTTLNSKEKIAFELLSLFPDGISLSNFTKCFSKGKSKNKISDNELRILRNKSLVEDYNGILQLQPIIRRFADFQFNKRDIEVKQKYCSDAYSFNCFILEIVDFTVKMKSMSEALKLFNIYKNNLLNVVKYIPEIEISPESSVSDKKYLLNYIYGVDDYVAGEKQIDEFEMMISDSKEYFQDLTNAGILIDVILLNKIYYHREFDNSYKKLSKFLSVEDMQNRDFNSEDYIEKRYKNMIANIHSMEGHTMSYVNAQILNNDLNLYLDSHFFYLGISDNISRKKDGFYYFEYELMFDRLDKIKLEKYISTLYSEEHLEIMQTTYTLSKVKYIDKASIQKLVVTNPYTKGLKELMFAFSAETTDEKIKHFNKALINLSHIKYYYLEALYYYCSFLKDNFYSDFLIKVEEGINYCEKYKYQYLSFLFNNLKNSTKEKYVFNYAYYESENLEDYVKRHNNEWEKIFKERALNS